jgi:hypothetical protein
MALAVAEARRVLRPGGLLLDIHPVGEPMRLEAWTARDGADPQSAEPGPFERRALGGFRPEATVEDFKAATRAIGAAAGAGFAPAGGVTFDDRYFFDSLDELTEYLEDNDELDLASDELLERALLALRGAAHPTRLVIIQPVIVTVLRKTG